MLKGVNLNNAIMFVVMVTEFRDLEQVSLFTVRLQRIRAGQASFFRTFIKFDTGSGVTY